MSAYSKLSEKVAAAIRDEDCCGVSLDGGKNTVFCDDPSLDEPQRICACKNLAATAIAATIQGLIEMELPDSIPDYVYEAEFRSILAALKPIFTKEAQS
jgi:hypothetical protein